MSPRSAATLLLTLLALLCPAICFSQTSEPASAEPADRYTVPEGDVSELVKFVDELRSSTPNSIEEQNNKVDALAKAATKILEMEKDDTSSAFQLATLVLIETKIQRLPSVDPNRQAAIIDEAYEYLSGRETMDQEDLRLAAGIPQVLESISREELAASAYKRSAELLRRTGIEGIDEWSDRYLAAARRLTLVGNSMELKGTTLDDEPFDLASLKGKVVLIDFWATWCGPCVAEIPNVKALYEKYHDRGFEVVGISLDQDRTVLERFTKDRDLPWTILHHDSATGQHPAADYYGITAIPAMFLVGPDGKVLSLNARGMELERLLADQFGSGETGAR